MHSATKLSPFEVVYGFNPLTPLDLLPLPDPKEVSLDGEKRAEQIRALHEEVRRRIEKNNAASAKAANRKRKPISFQPGDQVWIHLRKERFPDKRKSKLMARAEGPFRVLERVNDNAYKVELPDDYNVSATFNVRDLSPYLADIEEEPDLRSNPFQPGEDDVPLRAERQVTGPVTHSRSITLLMCDGIVVS